MIHFSFANEWSEERYNLETQKVSKTQKSIKREEENSNSNCCSDRIAIDR